MKVLVDCERSQVVTQAFRNRGFEAYSCDIEDEYGGFPRWHLKMDGVKALSYMPWDLVIVHPPCTFLCNSSVKHLYVGGRKENGINWDRVRKMELGASFFKKFIFFAKTTGIPTGIENPIMHGHAKHEIGIHNKYSQIIQPYQFGHMEQKATCIWLYNLPNLVETNNVYKEMMELPYKDRAKVHYASPGMNRSDIRSKTYSGIAEAMPQQWGDYIRKEKVEQLELFK